MKLDNLGVKTEGKAIVHGISLSLADGEMHVIMGPNGSGKTTLGYAISGHPAYETSGRIFLDSLDISKLKPDERARAGIFLAFQNPPSVEGVGLLNFMRKSANANGMQTDVMKFSEEARKLAKVVKMDESLLLRDLNMGLSGGEKKKSETLQMLSLQPKVAIIDEIDSGLDVDALKAVGKAIEKSRDGKRIFLIITHQEGLLKYLKPDVVHIMAGGRIVKSGGAKLANEIAKNGYSAYSLG